MEFNRENLTEFFKLIGWGMLGAVVIYTAAAILLYGGLWLLMSLARLLLG
jgi:hypothetical protein